MGKAMKLLYIGIAFVVITYIIGSMSLGPLGRALAGGDPMTVFQYGLYTISQWISAPFKQ